MIDWEWVAKGAGALVKEAGQASGNQIVSIIAEEAADLGVFAFQSVKNGLTIEAVIQQLQDRHFDLLNRLKG